MATGKNARKAMKVYPAHRDTFAICSRCKRGECENCQKRYRWKFGVTGKCRCPNEIHKKQQEAAIDQRH